jgi:hypothetical protein
MKRPFFIMIHNQRGDCVMPMTDADNNDEVAMFETVEEATEAAHSHHMCTAFGWDLFQAGCGIDGGDPL